MVGGVSLSLSRFRLERELGSGATGTVHEAVLLRPLGQLKTGAKVAVKFLHQNLTDDLNARRRFLREARAGLSIRHPNLIRIFAVEEVNLLGRKVLYLVMELVEGKTLRELVQDGEPLAEGLVRNIAKQIAAGLQALHQKEIVHLDVKPENIILTREGRAVLMDLGFARHIQSNSQTESLSGFAGSVAYAAPERIRGGGRFDPRSDLYSLGVTLYELCTAKLPFIHKDLAAVLHAHLEEIPKPPSFWNPRVSPFLDELILTLLSKDPAKRVEKGQSLTHLLEQGERSTWWQDRLITRRSAPSFHLRHRIPFRGREEEMKILMREWSIAQQGELRVVSLSGDEGTGKSRLVDEFAQRIREGNVAPLALYGRSPKLEEPPPCAPFLAVLERYLGLPSKAEPSPLELRRLRKLLPASEAHRLYQALREGLEETDPSEDSLANSFSVFLHAATKEGPVVLFLDDFSWADRASVRVLEFLTEDRKMPLLAILALRPDHQAPALAPLLDRLEEKSLLVPVVLRNLGENDVQSIVHSLFSKEPSVDEWAKVLFERSGGNPSLLREILSTLQSRGALVEKDGKWTAHSPAQSTPIPASIAEAVRERRNLLDPQERGLLECAAVAGVRFDAQLLAKAFGADPIEILQGLNHIEQTYGLLVSAGQGFRFTRPIVREVLYQDLDPEVRKEAHRRLALAIEETYRGRSMKARTALSLAIHASRGEDHKTALRVLPALVEWMHRRGVFEQVQTLSHLALKHLEHFPTTAQLLRKKFDLLCRAAESEGRLGMRAEEKKDLEECARIANELKDEKRLAETYFLLGRYAHTTGKYLTALGYLERAEHHFRKAGSSEKEREAILQRANVLSYLGDSEGAEALFHRLTRKNVEERNQLRAHLGLGKLLSERGHLELSQESFLRASAILQRVREPVGEILLRLYRTRANAVFGMLKEAKDDAEHGIALAQKLGERRLLCLLEVELGNLLAETQANSQAQDHLKNALERSRQTGDRYCESLAGLSYGEFLLEHGHPLHEIQKMARVALSAAEEAELGELRARGLLLLARVYLRQGQQTEAQGAVHDALDIVHNNPIPIYSKIVFYFRAYGILQGLGDGERAAWALERATRLAHAIRNLSKSKKVRESWERKPMVAALLKAIKRRELNW